MNVWLTRDKLGIKLDNRVPYLKSVLRTFYRSCIESVLTFSFLCLFGGLNVKSKHVLNKVVNVCVKVVGERQEQSCQLHERRVVQKARVIVEDKSHVLAKHYELIPSGRRFRVPKSNETLQSIAFLNR